VIHENNPLAAPFKQQRHIGRLQYHAKKWADWGTTINRQNAPILSSDSVLVL